MTKYKKYDTPPKRLQAFFLMIKLPYMCVYYETNNNNNLNLSGLG